jgi:peptide/nickel transport system ATP-binding protein
MRQRVMIAAALACKPSLLLADEPTTALDVTAGADSISEAPAPRRGLSIILVSHDLGVVAQIAIPSSSRRTARWWSGPVGDIIERPRMDYTQRLIASQPP